MSNQDRSLEKNEETIEEAKKRAIQQLEEDKGLTPQSVNTSEAGQYKNKAIESGENFIQTIVAGAQLVGQKLAQVGTNVKDTLLVENKDDTTE
eukprot:TRINITY_DN2924_c0_g1_i1.p1 TRINITY_DN2924_c0_g1~~TRINITY_DN2924_c0_g1_i1.p1  ORF type:complete len:105 (-),score=37.19 TRINITY_DN2924_c0_g1_i1:4-282(-)